MAIVVAKYCGLKDKRSFGYFLKQFFNGILDDGISLHRVLQVLYNHLDPECQIYYDAFAAKERRLGFICYQFAKVFSSQEGKKESEKEIKKVVEVVNEFIRIAKKREKGVCCFSFLSSLNNRTENNEVNEKSVLFIDAQPITKQPSPKKLSSSNTKGPKVYVLKAELPSKKKQLQNVSPTVAVGPAPPIRALQNYSAIKKRCLKNGELFEDDQFQAAPSSLYYCRRPKKQIKWLRPGQIVKKPLFFSNGISRFDVAQGELGDCWLLAALANLTLHKEILYQVVDPHQSFSKDYAGIFYFKFWQYGKWVDVVIDDRLPTFNGELIYMHSSDSNEFWSALLEKAYAKLFGSYEALDGGWACEALEDMSGGLTEVIDMKNDPPKNLLKMISRGIQMGSLFGCSINEDLEVSNGLFGGHAYSITGVQIVNGKNGPITLIRVRNPWGKHEWNGKWSDDSSEWDAISFRTKGRMEFTFEDDGEFWMSFDDFKKNFESLEICHVEPKVMEDISEAPSESHNSWSVKAFHGAWCNGKTAGGPRNNSKSFSTNPQYLIKLAGNTNDEEHTLIIGVLQKYRRELQHDGVETLSIKFAVFKLENNFDDDGKMDKSFFAKTKPIFESKLIYYKSFREVSSRLRLLSGKYLIVPFTVNANEEANFMLRIFSDGIVESDELH